MKSIYIVLIKAHTGLGKIARCLMHYEYTHIAVSFDRSLKEFISFSRRKHELPMDAGFMYEYRDYYAFGKHQRVKIKAFKLPVTDEVFKHIEAFMSQCEGDKDYLFNLFSMLTMPVLHGFYIYKTHNCMSFTAKVVELSQTVILKKPYYKYSIKDLDQLLKEYLFFEGYLKKIDSPDYQAYMQKSSLFEKIGIGIKTVLRLLARVLYYKNRVEES